MRSIILALSVCLVVGACAPERPAKAEPDTAATRASASDPSGVWRLTRMNGQAADQPHGGLGVPAPITLAAGGFTLRSSSECVAFWHRYQRTADGRVLVSNDNPGAMCARGLTPWEAEFDRALSAVDRIEASDDRLRLSGPGVELMFEAAPTPPRTRFAGRWRLDAIDERDLPPGDPIEILVTDDLIRADACVFAGWRYAWAGGLLEVSPVQDPVCERMSSPREQAFGAVMDGVVRATVHPDGTLELGGALSRARFRPAN